MTKDDNICCGQCQTPLSEVDRSDARYLRGEGCVYCLPVAGEAMAWSIARRHAAMQLAFTPQPGSRPQDHFKPVNIPARFDGLTLLEALCGMVPEVTRPDWEAECKRGRLQNRQGEAMCGTQVVRAGEQYQHQFPQVREPEVNGAVEILHEEEAFLVLNKPAPLPMHAGGRFYLNTLQQLLNEAYRPEKPLPVHRLDANTTGLVLVARTRYFAAKLQAQFLSRLVQKTYLVRVQGHPLMDEFYCDAPISAEPERLCARKVDWEKGQASRTDFMVRQRNADGTTLLEARPFTGRTNQIRLHLSHLGWPVKGDTVYLAGGQTGQAQTLGISEAPLCLHAWRLVFRHPVSGEQVEFKAPLPASWNDETT